MKNRVYLLKSDLKNYSLFIHRNSDGEENISNQIVKNLWKSVEIFFPIKLELDRGDIGKKNYQFDISSFLSPFFVISEHTLTALADILEPRGQVLPVITESKRKQYFGYYPTNPLKGCFDKEKSVYREFPNGLMIDKPILIAKNITDDYLFSIEEDISRVFVTDKFKKRVEEAGLLGFDFSVEIPTS